MKSIFKSKTIWVNLVTLAAASLTYVVDHNLFVDNPDVTAALVAVLALVNVGLRVLTKQPVSIAKPKPEAN